MAYPSLKIANYFIERGINSDTPITPMQILKLVYIANGWSLGTTGKSLIDDKVYAWKYGPVIPSIYNAFKEHGSKPVKEALWGYSSEDFSPDEETILDFVWRNYGHLNGFVLSAMTHKDGTPWSECYAPGVMDIEITEESIKRHYQELADKYKRNSHQAATT